MLLYFGQPAWVPLILLTLPLAVRLVRAVFTASSYALNRTLTGTAQLAVLYLAAFAVGLVL